jgi:hypothetical protein
MVVVVPSERYADTRPVLELRPICENCAAALPPESDDAMICSFECTFCRDCATTALGNVCPNCGGGFVPRPVRPVTDWKDGNTVATYPPSTSRRHRPVDLDAHARFAAGIRDVAPSQR